MTVLFETDARLAGVLEASLPAPVAVVDNLRAVSELLHDDGTTDLVVIGPSVDLHAALRFSEDGFVTQPGVGVVLVRYQVGADVLNQAVRSGVRDVVAVDESDRLRDACEHSLELSRRLRDARSIQEAGPPVRPPGQLITVFTAKGGCGKTTIATNLAAVLAGGGKRRVCIVDLDVGFGDVAVALQLQPVRTLGDAVGLESKLDETAIRSLLTSHSPGLDVLPAPIEPGVVERLSPALVGDMLELLKTLYDYVVVDTAPAFTDHVLAAFDHTDCFVLLATLDILALKNLKLTLETLELLGAPRDRWRILLNMADVKVGLSAEDVEKTIDMPLSGRIPFDRAVPASVNRGVPIVLDQPRHQVSQAIAKFAATALPRTPVATGADTPRAERRSRGLLRRSAAA